MKKAIVLSAQEFEGLRERCRIFGYGNQKCIDKILELIVRNLILTEYRYGTGICRIEHLHRQREPQVREHLLGWVEIPCFSVLARAEKQFTGVDYNGKLLQCLVREQLSNCRENTEWTAWTDKFFEGAVKHLDRSLYTSFVDDVRRKHIKKTLSNELNSLTKLGDDCFINLGILKSYKNWESAINNAVDSLVIKDENTNAELYQKALEGVGLYLMTDLPTDFGADCKGLGLKSQAQTYTESLDEDYYKDLAKEQYRELEKYMLV